MIRLPRTRCRKVSRTLPGAAHHQHRIAAAFDGQIAVGVLRFQGRYRRLTLPIAARPFAQRHPRGHHRAGDFRTPMLKGMPQESKMRSAKMCLSRRKAGRACATQATPEPDHRQSDRLDGAIRMQPGQPPTPHPPCSRPAPGCSVPRRRALRARSADARSSLPSAAKWWRTPLHRAHTI